MTPSTIVTKPSRRLVAALGVVAATCTFLVTAGESAGAATTTTDKVVAKDSFGGSNRALGAAEVGGSWAAKGPAGKALTAGGGLLSVPTIPRGGGFSALLPTASAADVTVRHSVKLPSVGGARIGLYESTVMRHQADGDRYAATLVVGAGGAFDLRLDRVVDGKETVIGRVTPGVKLSSGGWLNVESQVTGTSPVTVKARVWKEGQAVPQWQAVAQDGTGNAVKAGGAVGLTGYLSSGGTATALSVDDFTAADRVTTTTAPAAFPAPQPAKPVPGTTPKPRPTTSPNPIPTTPTPTTPAVPGLPTLQQVTTNGFQHPGILNSATSLADVRANVRAGKEPWASAFTALKKSGYAKSSWTPHPVTVVGCGANSSPDEGCTEEKDDAQAAYANALMWYFTGDKAYAETAKRILDAWSGTLTGHKFDTKVYVNGRLQAAWTAQTFTKAAELVRYSGAGWEPAKVARFENLLKTAFLPMVKDGWTGGGHNWLLSMADATTAIGVFTNDRAVFEDGVGDWRKQVTSAFYLASDGAQPKLPVGTVITTSRIDSYWNAPTRWVDGLQGETCRDAGHMAMGFAAALDTAETASIQGIDLYGEQRRRLVTGMEFNARFLNNPNAAGWPCAAPLKWGGAAYKLTWEVGYNHYAGDLGIAMPETKRLLSTLRPTGSMLFVNWETLTHGSNA
ncbi:alginate lyase family protein [Kineococcus sp. NPDC059986]|uniref:alginate lyase family protein n=1 Tax=Kineococcus sp. NPDC059986 TaxID=3155538 RepID=UPI00344FABCF